MANAIYNALEELDGQVATVKLLCKKDTLVAKRLWVDLVDVGLAPTEVQLRGLKPETLALLGEIDSAAAPITVDRDRRDGAKDLALRLLVCATGVHTESGHHVNVYSSWQLWARDHHVVASGGAAQARRRFNELVAGWPTPGRSKRLPW